MPAVDELVCLEVPSETCAAGAGQGGGDEDASFCDLFIADVFAGNALLPPAFFILLRSSRPLLLACAAVCPGVKEGGPGGGRGLGAGGTGERKFVEEEEGGKGVLRVEMANVFDGGEIVLLRGVAWGREVTSVDLGASG